MKKSQLMTFIPGLVALTALAGGCASSASSSSYSAEVARTAFDVRYGEVVSTRPVEIQGEATIVGRLGGAWIGYALGLGNGGPYRGNARAIETAVGSVAGTVAGEAVERAARRQDGLEIVVRLSGNRTIAVVQAADRPFSPGEPVAVLYGKDGSTRVRPR